MILYINVTQLSKFDRLYKENEELQILLERWTGIKWKLKEEYKEDIERILKNKNIKYSFDTT
jgi:hypothetical protein